MADDALGSLRVNVSADLSELQSELGKIPGIISESVSSNSKGLRRHSGSSPTADRRAGSRDVGRASPEGAVDFAVLAFWAFDEPKNQRKQ